MKTIASPFFLLVGTTNAFVQPGEPLSTRNIHTLSAIKPFDSSDESIESRRGFFSSTKSSLLVPSIVSFLTPQVSNAGQFTPGGTLVDRDVGVTVGNPEASPSRKQDNSNVLFAQDNYFKFGQATKWIEPDSTDFPVTMPFVLSQQRYDTLKKYGSRVISGAEAVKNLDKEITNGDYGSVASADDPKFSLRPAGLLANGFLGSENTGTTNELLLARWYINEIFLRIGDIRSSTSEADALAAHSAAKKAMNSYLSMMNRVITSKVGNKFEYV